MFSTVEERTRKIAQRLKVGIANINGVGEAADLPFGGVKRYGFARELGPLGMDEFANKRLSTSATDAGDWMLGRPALGLVT